MKNKSKLKPFETALLLALSISLLAGAWASAKGGHIASGLVRLHVVAASDEPAEQAVKLEVRDSVLAYLEPKLEGAGSAREALALLRGELGGIEAAASSAAGGREVRVELGEEYYPTREYEGFSLPAGRYNSLRVVLGEGAGRNWWCVVFPPLCLEAASEEAFAALDGGTRAIISEDSPGVVFKFRVVELWNELLHGLGIK